MLPILKEQIITSTTIVKILNELKNIKFDEGTRGFSAYKLRSN